MEAPPAPAPPPPWLLVAHYWLPIGIGASLALVMQQVSAAPLSPSGLTVLLAGIGAAYSFDRWGDAPSASLRRFLIIATFLFSLLVLWGVEQDPGRRLPIVAFLGVATLFYPLLKRLPLLKTVVVSTVWVAACALLPLENAHQHLHLWEWIGWGITPPLLLFLGAGCLLCDLKDQEEDRRRQVGALAVLWGEKWNGRIAALLAFSAAALAASNTLVPLALAALLLGGVALWNPPLLRRRVAGSMLVDTILMLPGILLVMSR